MLERLREGQNEALLEVDGYQLLLKHLDSVYWPGGEGRNPVTKRDYLRYLISISPLLINHMMNRPVTLIRFMGKRRMVVQNAGRPKPPFVKR